MSQETLLPFLSDTLQKLWKYTGCLRCLGEWLSAVTGEGRRWFLATVNKGRLGLVFTLPGKMVPWSFWGSRFFYFLPNFRCWGQDFSWRETKLCYSLVFASKGGQLKRKTLFKIRLSSQKPLQEMLRDSASNPVTYIRTMRTQFFPFEDCPRSLSQNDTWNSFQLLPHQLI